MASALETAQKAILTRLLGGLPTGITQALTQWPNTPFVPPSPSSTPGLWLRVDLLWGDGFPVTVSPIGSNRARNTIAGVLQLTVSGPVAKGGSDVNTAADTLRDLFNRQEFNGVRCDVVSGPSPGPSPDGTWWSTMLRVPFTVDETH